MSSPTERIEARRIEIGPELKSKIWAGKNMSGEQVGQLWADIYEIPLKGEVLMWAVINRLKNPAVARWSGENLHFTAGEWDMDLGNPSKGGSNIDRAALISGPEVVLQRQAGAWTQDASPTTRSFVISGARCYVDPSGETKVDVYKLISRLDTFSIAEALFDLARTNKE